MPGSLTSVFYIPVAAETKQRTRKEVTFSSTGGAGGGGIATI